MSAQGPLRKLYGERTPGVSTGFSRTDWETPPRLYNKLHREFHFTLDAAANESNRKCERWLEGPCIGGLGCTCGLCSDWLENTVWLNPPYGAGLHLWIEKCYKAASGGATVVALLPANTDTAWFSMIVTTADEIRLLRRRVQFVGGGSSNTGGSCVAIWRPGPNHAIASHIWLWNWDPVSLSG